MAVAYVTIPLDVLKEIIKNDEREERVLTIHLISLRAGKKGMARYSKKANKQQSKV